MLGGMLTLRLGLRLENLGYAPLLQLNVNEATGEAAPQGAVPRPLPSPILVVDHRVDDQRHLDLALHEIRAWPGVDQGQVVVKAAALVCRLVSVDSGAVAYWGYHYKHADKVRLPWEAEAESNLR